MYKKEPPDFSKKGIGSTLVFRIFKKTPFSQRPRKGYYAKGLLSYNEKTDLPFRLGQIRSFSKNYMGGAEGLCDTDAIMMDSIAI